MSQVLQFLESLGRDGHPAHLVGREFEAMVSSLDIDDAQRQALLDRDAAGLGNLLSARPVMLCSIFPADEPQREDVDTPEDRPDETPEDEER